MGMGFPRNRPPWADDSYRTVAAPPRAHPEADGRAIGAYMTFTSTLVVILGGAIGTLPAVFHIRARAADQPPAAVGHDHHQHLGVVRDRPVRRRMTLASGRYPVPENLRLFVMIGICGGYTTFSSASCLKTQVQASAARSSSIRNRARPSKAPVAPPQRSADCMSTSQGLPQGLPKRKIHEQEARHALPRRYPSPTR